jgi:hypothetical protein
MGEAAGVDLTGRASPLPQGNLVARRRSVLRVISGRSGRPEWLLFKRNGDLKPNHVFRRLGFSVGGQREGVESPRIGFNSAREVGYHVLENPDKTVFKGQEVQLDLAGVFRGVYAEVV